MASPIPTINFPRDPATPNKPVISVPDTPSSRELVANWTRQAARRHAAQQALFSGRAPSTSSSSSRIPARDQVYVNELNGRAAPSTSNSTVSARDLHHPHQINDPEIVISEVPNEGSELIAETLSLDRHITSKVISGCSNSTRVTSAQAFDMCLSTTDIRTQFPEIYETKKNRCATTPGLFSLISEKEKQIKVPSQQQGDALRDVLTSFTSATSSEYRTTARINSELILCALRGMDLASNKCFLNQFHRGISCSEHDFEIFEDHCALGEISDVPINYSLPIELTVGFSMFQNDVFLIRFVTALTDFMAYTSNSELQQHYANSLSDWHGIRLKPEMKADLFANTEEESFAYLETAGAAARRSVPDMLDRGLIILKSLPPNVKTYINKQAMKKSIPENMMDRDWVIDQIKRIEKESKSKYSWSAPTATKLCAGFLNGNCTYGNSCRFLHSPTKQGTAPSASIQGATPIHGILGIQGAAYAALITTPSAHHPAADDITITCSLKHSPACTQTFMYSPSYWATLKSADGKPFDTPKSCKPCRTLKKQLFSQRQTASLFTAHSDEIHGQNEEHEQHENDGADDDFYSQIADYSMSVSGA
jgi:hypothetical protein